MAAMFRRASDCKWVWCTKASCSGIEFIPSIPSSHKTAVRQTNRTLLRIDITRQVGRSLLSASVFQKIVANLTPVAPRPVMIGVIMHDCWLSQLLRKDTGGNTSCVQDPRVVARRTITCRSGRAGVTGWNKYMGQTLRSGVDAREHLQAGVAPGVP